MSEDRVARIVDAIVESFPLPADYRTLVPGQRRTVERQAAALGITPDAHWQNSRRLAERQSTDRRVAQSAAEAVLQSHGRPTR